MAYDPIQHDLLYIRNRIILLKKVLLVKVAYFCVNSFYHHFCPEVFLVEGLAEGEDV